MKCPHCGKETEEAPVLKDLSFEDFQRTYPKRRGGQRWPAARKAFVRLIRTGDVLPIDLIMSAARYQEFCKKCTVRPQFVMQAATFLGDGGGWEEDWDLHAETQFDVARRQLQEQT